MAAFRVSDVVSESFGLVARNLGAFVSTQGILLIAFALVSLPFQVLYSPVSSPIDLTNATAVRASRGATTNPFTGILGIASLFLGFAASGIGMVVADALLRGERRSLKDAWARVKPRYWNLAGTTILILLIILAILLVALVIAGPAVIIGALSGSLGPSLGVAAIALGVGLFLIVRFSLRWALATPVSMLEDHPASANLGRSSELTQGSRAAIFGAYLLVWLIAIVPVVLVVTITIAHSVSDLQHKVLSPIPMPTRAINWALTSIASIFGGFLFAATNVVVYRKLVPPPVALELPPY